jgi:hypothetical protein
MWQELGFDHGESERKERALPAWRPTPGAVLISACRDEILA